MKDTGHRGSGAASAKADTASVWGGRGNSEATPETHLVSSEFAVPSAVPPESSALDQRRAGPVPRETTRVPNATQGSYGLLPPPDQVQRIRQKSGVSGSARRARALRRLRARRSSTDSPPHTPSSWWECMAHLKQVSATSQRRQMTLALLIW